MDKEALLVSGSPGPETEPGFHRSVHSYLVPFLLARKTEATERGPSISIVSVRSRILCMLFLFYEEKRALLNRAEIRGSISPRCRQRGGKGG